MEHSSRYCIWTRTRHCLVLQQIVASAGRFMEQSVTELVFYLWFGLLSKTQYKRNVKRNMAGFTVRVGSYAEAL